MPDLEDSIFPRLPDTVLLRGRRPYTAALQLAASRTIDELEARTCDGSRIAMVALGEVLVLRALKADVAAHTLIADRIEGRMGVRADEVAHESLAAREATQELVANMIEAFTAAKLAAGDSDDERPPAGALAAAVEADVSVPRAAVELDPSVERWRSGESSAWDRRP